uniref:GG17096 n=2 Tax=Drosophila erecta TaxID=7220 RepID=B3P463_DROER
MALMTSLEPLYQCKWAGVISIGYALEQDGIVGPGAEQNVPTRQSSELGARKQTAKVVDQWSAVECITPAGEFISNGPWMHRENAYSKEAELKNLAKRELANGLDKDPIYKLRLQCFSRGATGILGLSRSFRVMDDDGSKSLSPEEFKKGVTDIGLDLSDSEIDEMFSSFDTDGSGNINMTEFLVKLRPPMNNSRVGIIEKAFDKMDANGDGQITVADLKNVYSVRDHPKYLSGEMTEAQIFTQFLKNFEVGAPNPDGIVTKEEFINYYATISASIDNDAYFDLMMRQAYKL